MVSIDCFARSASYVLMMDFHNFLTKMCVNTVLLKEAVEMASYPMVVCGKYFGAFVNEVNVSLSVKSLMHAQRHFDTTCSTSYDCQILRRASCIVLGYNSMPVI